MPRTGLTLAAILLLPLAAAQAEPGPLDLRFDAPAQAGPDVTAVEATWLLVVFGNEGSGDVSLRFPRAALERNVTVASSGDAHGAETASSRALPSFGAEARFEGLSSIYLEGERLRVHATGAQASIVRPADGCVASLLDGMARKAREARYDDLCPPDGGPALVLRPDGGDGGEGGDAGARTVPVRIEAEGLRVVEVHHAAMSCRGEPGCPGGGNRDEVSAPPGVGITARVLSYSRLESGEAAAFGSGRAAHVLAGASSFDLAVQGWVRLPLADGGPVAGQTLRAEGNLMLADLRLGPDGRMAASLAGDVQHARLDEGGVDPALLFGVGAAGAAAAAVAAFAWLFSRIPASRSLDHPRRRLMMEAIRANPGIHLRELARLVGGSPTLAQYHAGVLVRGGHVVERRQGKRLCLFENHGRYGDEWHALAALHSPPLLQLHRHVAASPGVSRADVVRVARAWGWSRRTAYHRLLRLEQLGLVREGGAFGSGLHAFHPAAQA